MADIFSEYRGHITEAARSAQSLYSSITLNRYYRFTSRQKILYIQVTNKTLAGSTGTGYDINLTGNYFLVNTSNNTIEAKKGGTISNILQSNTTNPDDDYSEFSEVTVEEMRNYIQNSYNIII
jgi:hypothetical protein